jgi:class 3 adenylate cyclase/uncharacterized protein (DUF427 family)
MDHEAPPEIPQGEADAPHPQSRAPGEAGEAIIDAIGGSAPDYRFTFEPYPYRIQARFADQLVVDSEAAMVLHETRLAPVHYFPREHVRMDLMRPTARRTHCPFKGNARYWTLEAGGRVAENVMWSYEEPIDDAAAIGGYVAFYADMLDAWLEDGRERSPGREDRASHFDNPLMSWLMTDAPSCPDPSVLTRQLSVHMIEAGIPLWRLNVIIRTLHPQLMALSYRWWRKSEELEEAFIPYEALQHPRFLDSPLVPIFDGAGGIRRRLDVSGVELDFPIIRDLHAEGATDYVAMPMTFSDGQINALTLASDRRGGFSTRDLGHVYEILAVLGRLYEVHAMRYRATTLLDTYLGRHAGERVLNGLIKRGDGENIEAVIWFCDLRESTPLARSMPREDFLRLLDRFFDCMAGAVLDHGGQVLRYIGDAALAIFPIGESAGDAAMSAEQARERALEAAVAACERMQGINEARRAKGRTPLGYGIGLHQGEVTYGNIGAQNRLEFTVIGDAANRAARIESMCKVLDHPVIVSAAIARGAPQRFESMGRHELRGVDEPVELFALRGVEA